MKITETQRIRGSTPAQDHAARDVVTVPERSGRTTRDTASIMGIPAEELSPRVQQAVTTLMAEVDRLKRDLDQSRRRLRETEDMADQDPLLPMLNRRAFERELGRVISYTKRYDGEASLIFLDLDHFKQINDLHGHAAGDAVLRAVADLLLRNVRQSDIAGRIGGDEFAVILMQTPTDLAHVKADTLQGLIKQMEIEFEGKTLRMSSSAGTARIEAGTDAATVLARADLAMYEQKSRLSAD